jgi:hypothetical protein
MMAYQTELHAGGGYYQNAGQMVRWVRELDRPCAVPAGAGRCPAGGMMTSMRSRLAYVTWR